MLPLPHGELEIYSFWAVTGRRKLPVFFRLFRSRFLPIISLSVSFQYFLSFFFVRARNPKILSAVSFFFLGDIEIPCFRSVFEINRCRSVCFFLVVLLISSCICILRCKPRTNDSIRASFGFGER
ncbi:hypothetical protein ES332_D02G000300v1 [Gossypium tomentosum]|uniref:Uncharacterized protein n=1 Tax=Gossypium tomentosum TaxID=34277 RepID=A0A5D2LRK8_GOSTO|nr:hypothetical protein ES332_D02G000300v1 [Gossypium tomentosum]